VTSDRAGVRARIELLENGRRRVAGVLKAAGDLKKRLVSIMMVGKKQWFRIEDTEALIELWKVAVDWLQ
jgi:hypothetical protein